MMDVGVVMHWMVCVDVRMGMGVKMMDVDVWRVDVLMRVDVGVSVRVVVRAVVRMWVNVGVVVMRLRVGARAD